MSGDNVATRLRAALGVSAEISLERVLEVAIGRLVGQSTTPAAEQALWSAEYGATLTALGRGGKSRAEADSLRRIAAGEATHAVGALRAACGPVAPRPEFTARLALLRSALGHDQADDEVDFDSIVREVTGMRINRHTRAIDCRALITEWMGQGSPTDDEGRPLVEGLAL